MQLLLCLCIWLSFLGCTIGATDADLNGLLKLYASVEYKNPFTTIKFNYASRCYSLDCDALDNKAASAKWDKLPNSTSDTLIFYSEADCTGHRGTARLSKSLGVSDFKKLKGTISAFMVKTIATTSDQISKRGESNVCSWTSVGVGGVAEEDPTLALVLSG
ncbi:Importin subunit alpha [Phytophthora cinnamomi]|uniref:Importin subunit alpha n=1 Tax=Phytophthora cinnamomi TaxID=4785 RepID=UPI003559BE2E|nr:Importin subunit alpha [Phytophthora cinnamomi]